VLDVSHDDDGLCLPFGDGLFIQGMLRRRKESSRWCRCRLL